MPPHVEATPRGSSSVTTGGSGSGSALRCSVASVRPRWRKLTHTEPGTASRLTAGLRISILRTALRCSAAEATARARLCLEPWIQAQNPSSPPTGHRILVPPREVAGNFSVEVCRVLPLLNPEPNTCTRTWKALYSPHPIGVHGFDKDFLGEPQMQRLLQDAAEHWTERGLST